MLCYVKHIHTHSTPTFTRRLSILRTSKVGIFLGRYFRLANWSYMILYPVCNKIVENDFYFFFLSIIVSYLLGKSLLCFLIKNFLNISFEYFSFPASYYFSWLNFILKGTPGLDGQVLYWSFTLVVIPIFHGLPGLFMGEKYWYLSHNLVKAASSFNFIF